MGMFSSNASLTWNRQPQTCVLDPGLAFSPYGLPLVKHLREYLELWVVRELWHILDNPRYYLQQPESMPLGAALDPADWNRPTHRQQMNQTFQDWQSIRMSVDPTNLKLFWIGDRPSESFLPSGTDPQLAARWESLARSLDRQFDGRLPSSEILAPALRDTAALAAALSSAFILTYQPEGSESNLTPEICLTLDQWGIPCQAIAALDPIAALEREHLIRLIITAGFSKFLWAGLHLVVLHLIVPSAFTLRCEVSSSLKIDPSNGERSTEGTAPARNLWKGAQGYWYQL